MPAHNRVVLSGTLASGQETWSTSCAFNAEGNIAVTSPQDLTDWAEAIATDLGTITPASFDRALSQQGTITEVSCYYYPDNVGPAQAVGVGNAVYSGLFDAVHPLQTAIVISLKTGLSGRRYRGRMYWPAVGLPVGTTGRFSSTFPTTFPADSAEFLEGIASRAPGAIELRPIVVSKAGGFVTPVTSVSVGDVPDTQRRRRDDLAETVLTSAYPAP